MVEQRYYNELQGVSGLPMGFVIKPCRYVATCTDLNDSAASTSRPKTLMTNVFICTQTRPTSCQGGYSSRSSEERLHAGSRISLTPDWQRPSREFYPAALSSVLLFKYKSDRAEKLWLYNSGGISAVKTGNESVVKINKTIV